MDIDRYLHTFEENVQRTQYEGGWDYIEPYASLVEEDNSVHYNNPRKAMFKLKNGNVIAIYGKGELTRGEYQLYDSAITEVYTTKYCTSIANQVFQPKSTWACQLTSVTLSDSIEHIGSSAFCEVRDSRGTIQSLTIPDSVTSMGTNVFRNNLYIRNVKLSNSLTTIPSGTFYGCQRLTSVTIPNDITSIGTSAFTQCKAITSINIPNTVTSIGGGAFRECTNLTSLTFPEGIKTINETVIASTPNLTSFTVPNSVTTIGNYGLNGANGLRELTIGSGVTYIAYYNFNNTTNLTSFTILATTPPSVRTETFSGKSFDAIYVPAASVDRYKTASGWSKYASVIQAIPT